MSPDRGQIRVVDTSWHFQLYNWYIKSHPLRAEYQENLCHYMRVILIWTPLHWFMRGNLIYGIPPVWLALLTGIVGLIILGLNYFPALVFATFGIGLGVIIVVLLAMVIESTPIGRPILIVTSPIWGPFFAVYYLCFEIGARADEYTQLKFQQTLPKWFFTAHKFWVITPFTVLLTVLFTAASLIFGASNVLAAILPWMLIILAGTSGIFVSVLILVGIGLLGSLIKEKFADWRSSRRERKLRLTKITGPHGIYVKLERPSKNGTSSYQGVWQYLVAQKRRICPYIEVVRS